MNEYIPFQPHGFSFLVTARIFIKGSVGSRLRLNLPSVSCLLSRVALSSVDM